MKPDNLKFVTGNADKIREAEQILGISMEQVVLENLNEIQTNDVLELVEHKVKLAYGHVRSPVLVEDSALVFKAWKDLPGTFVKWFEHSVGCEGMIKMLEPFANKSAIASCLVAYFDGQVLKTGRGEVSGRVAPDARGENGFGWDVLFIPDGYQITFAEMTPQEKNSISHRKRAFESLKETF